MGFLHTLDYVVIALYFLTMLGVGFYLSRMASVSLEDYLLGGRKLPWWALGTSGMASWLDVTGTMIIVSFLNLLGPQVRRAMKREHFYDIITVPIAMTGQVALFLVAMQLVIGAYRAMLLAGAVFIVSQIALYFTWYRQLPPATPTSPQA